jgi:hypothetical protein
LNVFELIEEFIFASDHHQNAQTFQALSTAAD